MAFCMVACNSSNSEKTNSEKINKYLRGHRVISASKWTNMMIYPSSHELRTTTKWGDEAYLVEIYKDHRQGISIIIKNESVQAIRICDFSYKYDKNIMEIKVGNSPWCDFRLSREECKSLFGITKREESYFVP